VESENEVKAGVGVDDGVEDGIDIVVGANVGGGEIFLLLDRGLKFVQVLGFVHVGVSKLGCSNWVFKFGRGFQVSAFRLGCSSLCVQVGVFRWVRFVNSWFPFFDGVSLPTTSR
jgi:hypothetical protein